MSTKRLVNLGLDTLTWLVLLVMLAPVFWLIASSLQTDGQLSNGAYDLLHPTFVAFKQMWSSVDFGRYFANSAIICVIAFRTAQLGFVPANVFCLAIYGYNIAKWKSAS